MEVQEKVNPVLLYAEHSELKNTQLRAKGIEKDLNAFINLVQGEIKRKLSKDEALQVKDDALNWLEANLTFALPNAPEKLKYDSVGVDIWLLKNQWQSRTWAERNGKGFLFTWKDGAFRLNDEQPLYEGLKRYATDRQLEVLKQAQTLADALNVATEQELNIVHTYSGRNALPLYKIKDTFRVVKYNEPKKMFEPNKEYIARMKG